MTKRSLYFKTPDEKEIRRRNRLQQKKFDALVHLFDPPLPEGVPERLTRIAAAAQILPGEVVLDVGTGTGILVPEIQKYRPGCVYACDLSEMMLAQLHINYSGVESIQADVRDLALPDTSIDVVFINACYPNIVDKAGAFSNLSRMLKPGGRLIISHPLGKQFVLTLQKSSPFALDELPRKFEAEQLFAPYGFKVKTFVDEPELYILKLSCRPKQNISDK